MSHAPLPRGVPAGVSAHIALRWAADIGIGVAFVGVVCLGAHLAAPILSDADVVMSLLLAVIVLAFWRGRRAAVIASLLSVAAFNFFFVPPFHTFAVADTRNLLTFLVLFLVGLAASTLAERLRLQEIDAVAREKRTAALLSLTQATASAADEAAVAEAIVLEAATRIASGAAIYGADGVRIAQAGSVSEGDTAIVAAAHDGPVSHGAFYALPVATQGQVLGVLVLREPLPGIQDLAGAYARHTALALARVRQAAIAEAATLRARTEELRSALLSTVSHDLRTPLSAITGAATALLDPGLALSADDRTSLVTAVRDEAARLERLVANLLEMTRLASGPLALRRDWVPVDELVGAAFSRVDAVLADHPTTTTIEPNLPLVEVDPVVFEHVLVNLLENAARHTPAGTPVHLTVGQREGAVVFTVSDEGPGFPPGDLSTLFDPFVRGAPPGVPGSGLGLAISRGIVAAHGGAIHAERTPTGGAAVVVLLPRYDPPAMPLEREEPA